MAICCKCLENSSVFNGDMSQVFGRLCCFQWQYVTSVWNTVVFNGYMSQMFGTPCCFSSRPSLKQFASHVFPDMLQLTFLGMKLFLIHSVN